MAAAQQPGRDDQSSPGLAINLSSNNPFRNRAGSPLPKSPASPFDEPSFQGQPPSRPSSNNPFLDPSHNKPGSASLAQPPPPLITMADDKESTPTSATEDLFASLNIGDNKAAGKNTSPPSRSPQGPPGARRPVPPRGENAPPSGGRRGPPPPPGHRSRGSGPPSSNSPPRRMASSATRPSRGPGRPLTEEEKKKRRDHERRQRDGKSGKAKPHRDHDLIDKLDETNPFGASLVHHAGPYDAVFSKKKKNSPLEAFAKDSANMSIGGSGPINARADHSTFMGHANDEAFADYGITPAPPVKKEVALFNPHDRASQVHGDETHGLGSSTFLEGTPAAKAAVEKAEQENFLGTMDGGLQRKKSLAQRIRGMNRPPREGFSSSGRMTNPEGVYYRDRPSAGGTSSPRDNNNNPFFAEYEPSKDGEEQISVRKADSGSPTSPPPMPGQLERRATSDALSEQPKPKTGLLGRMKSLKGGPRSRPVDKNFE